MDDFNLFQVRKAGAIEDSRPEFRARPAAGIRCVPGYPSVGNNRWRSLRRRSLFTLASLEDQSDDAGESLHPERRDGLTIARSILENQVGSNLRTAPTPISSMPPINGKSVQSPSSHLVQLT